MKDFHAHLVDNSADLTNAIIAAERAGAIGTAHLLRAFAAGRINYWAMLPTANQRISFQQFVRSTEGQPAVISIGDDDGAGRGPIAWPFAAAAVAWTKTALIHAAGAQLSDYELVLIAAALVQRALVIECNSATLDLWVKFVANSPNKPAVLVIHPPAGIEHPRAIGRGALQ